MSLIFLHVIGRKRCYFPMTEILNLLHFELSPNKENNYKYCNIHPYTEKKISQEFKAHLAHLGTQTLNKVFDQHG